MKGNLYLEGNENMSQIDMSEVIINRDLGSVLEIRSAMNRTINEQNELIAWLLPRIDPSQFEVTEKEDFRNLCANSHAALADFAAALQKEDRVMGQNTKDRR